MYGDARIPLAPGEALASLVSLRRRLEESRSGSLARHAAAVQLLIAGGQIAQAALDHEHAARNEDHVSPLTRASHRLLLALGAQVVDSWDGLTVVKAAAMSPTSSGRGDGALDDGVVEDFLAALPIASGVLELRVPEGYAHYALYPETYLEAARRLAQNDTFVSGAAPLVVGVRSIGTSLGAVVAAALGGTLVTVRPRGAPFARVLRLSPELALHVQTLARAPRTVVVVDEGPGISGSSFGAVADWLEDHGARSVLCLPSHRGELGPVAAPRHRARWRAQPRPVVAREELFALQDLGNVVPLHGDGWRARLCGDRASWPPSHPQQEQPKYLVRIAGRAYIAKYAGLGAEHEKKLARARTLADAGFTPRPHALYHGIMLSEWYEHARPRRRGQTWVGCDLDRLARYLLARRQLSVPRRSHASAAELLAMTRANAAEVFGAARAASLSRFDRAPFLAEMDRLPRLASDNRLHPWEWIDLPDGRLLKCDTVDHAEGHDLLGPQTVAWDVAGACEELDLDPDAQDTLVRRVWPESLVFRPEHLLFARVAYLAFSLGHAGFAENACVSSGERTLWSRERERYQLALGARLDST